MELDFDFSPKAPLTKVFNSLSVERGIEVYMLREDLVGGDIQGNKWRKLRLHLHSARQESQQTLLSFGGVWSNHIYAVAAAGKAFGFQTIGIIRAEEPEGSTETLEFARQCGMKLQFVSRAEYGEREQDYFKAWLHDIHGSFHLIPEGGADFLGLNGCMDILSDHTRAFDVITVPCGTGTTLAGMLLSMQPRHRFIGFSAVKGGAYLEDEIITKLNYFLMDRASAEEYRAFFKMETDYAFGGFAKVNDDLIQFMRSFYEEDQIKLDPVYTGKMMFGLKEMIVNGRFVPGTKVLAVHTGGLQGIKGIEKRGGMELYY